MGRVRNAILDREYEVDAELKSLQKQITNNQETIDFTNEFINYELQNQLTVIMDDMHIIKTKLTILEKEKNQFFILLGIIAGIATLYYKKYNLS